MISTDASGGHLFRQGLDLVLDWADAASARLHNWKDHRDGGVKGELTITQNGAKYSWGSLSLASTTARGTLVKQLTQLNPDIPWRAHLEELAWRFTQEARVGEPLVTLTGDMDSDAEMLLPGWLYAGEPTLLYADGDTGKSLTALTFAVAMATGRALPGGLIPLRATPTAYLDWETSPATTNKRLGMLAAGFGIPPPPILYKRMTRPLVEEVGTLAGELARQKVGFVAIDSKMFAVSMGEGAAFHEPITAFYTALRLFAPAAVLVLNHVTNADAKRGTPARPFGGAFAFNGPRVIWEAKRDWDIEDATAIVFTCRKANNLARKPDAFGLSFSSTDDSGRHALQVHALSMADVDPKTMAGGSLTQRLKVFLLSTVSFDEIQDAFPEAKPRTLSRILQRLKREFVVTLLEDGRWARTNPVDTQVVNPVSSSLSTVHSHPPGREGDRASLPVKVDSPSYIGVVHLSTEPAWIHDIPPGDEEEV